MVRNASPEQQYSAKQWSLLIHQALVTTSDLRLLTISWIEVGLNLIQSGMEEGRRRARICYEHRINSLMLNVMLL